ncbi:MAG TPA: hypothetical protein VMU59_04405 [Caulobacteraceae bacterium]|nr:hypothetical protein [Caulobacteraceae bacterium]
MNPNKVMLAFALLASLGLAHASPAAAQTARGAAPRTQEPPLDPSIKTTFVHLGNGEPGVLYEPVAPGPKAQIAVFVMHSAGDYLTHSACTNLSKRGYRVLCANNTTSKSGEFNDGILDSVLLQAKAAIVYLRKYPGVKKIVLWGHSGGATIMTAYQDIAENGVKVCQDAAKIHKCPDSLANMPPADGVILGDANWGLAPITVIGIDPAVSDDDGMTLNPDLDMFNPKNGFKPDGSHYSPEFVRKFQAAEAKRYNSLVKLAQARLALIEAGKGHYADDEPFIIAGASFTENKLYAQDMGLMAHTAKAWPLLHPDGSITTEIVHSVRTPTLTENPSHNYMGAALKTTVRSFLMTYAIRVDDDFGYGEGDAIRGIEWTSSYASNPGNAEGITVPFLTLGMTGSYESATAETIHEHLKSADKTLVYVEGASHGYPACKSCEKTPGQYGDTVKTIYDYADGWLSKDGRFLNAATP